MVWSVPPTKPQVRKQTSGLQSMKDSACDQAVSSHFRHQALSVLPAHAACEN
jgi:hypothetical protein